MRERVRVLKIVKMFCGVAALLALLIFLTGAGGQKYAVEHRTHIVQVRENLFSVAAKYAPEQNKTDDLRELVYDIRQASGIKGDVIYPGQVLTIPLARKVEK